MSAVTFIFSLFDKMSAPAAKIAKAVGETGTAADKADKALGKTDKAAKKAGVALGETGEGAKKTEKAFIPLPGRLGKIEGALKEAYGDKTSGMFARFVRGNTNASDSAKVAELGFSGMKRGAGAAAAGLATVASAAAAAAAIVGVAAVALVAAGASYALDTLRFKQNTEFAWKYTQGSQANAAGTMALAAQLAGELGTSTKEVAAQMNEIFKSGAKGTEARGMIKLLADFKALGVQQDPKALADGLMAMAKGGQLDIGMLGPIIEKGDGAKVKVYESLAAKLNVKGKNIDDIQRQVDARIAAGAFRGQKGIQAYKDAIQNVTGQGNVGDLGKLFNNTTIDGSIDKIKGKFDELMTKLNTGKAGTAIVNALQKIAAAIDPGTESGAKLLATFDKLASIAGRLFANIDIDAVIGGFTTVVDMVDGAIGPITDFADAFSASFSDAAGPLRDLIATLSTGQASGGGFASMMKDIGSAMGKIVGTATLVAGAIGLVVFTLAKAATAVMGGGAAIGAAIIDGMSNGIDSAKGKLLDRLQALASLLPESVRKLLGIKSPSRVFAEIGKHTMQGFTAGIDGEADTVRDRTVSALSPKMTAAGASLGGGAAGGRGAMTVTMNIDASGATDPAAVRHAAEEGATAGTMRLFELLGLEAGAVGPAS